METASEKVTMVIRDKQETIYGNEGFAKMLREKLGDDACNFFLNAIDEKSECNGECDILYSWIEGRDNFLRDLQDELASWAIRKLTKAEIEQKRDNLYQKIEGVL